MRLASYRRLDPSPLEELFCYDPPTGGTRGKIVRQWFAEDPGRRVAAGRPKALATPGALRRCASAWHAVVRRDPVVALAVSAQFSETRKWQMGSPDPEALLGGVGKGLLALHRCGL